MGLAEDKAEASIACRQVGPIAFGQAAGTLQEEVFNERISLVFKRLRIVRMVDVKPQHPGLPDLFRPPHRRLAAEQRDRRAGGPRHTDSAQVSAVPGRKPKPLNVGR